MGASGADIDGEAAGDSLVLVTLSSDGSRVAIGAMYNDGNGSILVMYVFMIIMDLHGSSWRDIDGEAR